MVSIVIPVYNQAAKLSRCLDSILRQTILKLSVPSALKALGTLNERLELIIVNDGSTDDIESLIKKYENKFKNFLFIGQENKGSNPARNRGAREAKGEYIIFCDADIIMKPEMLEVMLRALGNNPFASYAYSSFKYGWKNFKLWPFDAEKLKQMPYIHTTSLIRREHFPGWDENIKRLQDWDLWLTMLENGRQGIWIDKILFKAHSGGMISTWLPSFVYRLMPFLKKVKRYKEAERVIKEKHKINCPFNNGG